MFLDFLLSENIITDIQYNRIITTVGPNFKGDITQALVSIGINEDAITAAKASFYKIPYQKVNLNAVSNEVLRFVEESAALHYKFVPIDFADGILSVGVTEPENIEGMNALQFISVKLGVPFKVFMISNSDYSTVVGRYSNLNTEVDQAIDDLNDELDVANQEVSHDKNLLIKNKNKIEPVKIVEDAPIIKIVSVIIQNAVEGLASDIHIENSGQIVKVRYRLDGILHTTLTLPLNTFDGIIARVKILARLRLDEKRKPQDGSFFTTIEGRKIEFRVSTFPAYFGEKVVMRILDSEKGVRTIEELDMESYHKKTVTDILHQPYGLVLISGPTGSGKSTTLYSMLNGVDKEANNVVSLEDPVEYQIPGVTQSQVMPEIGYTFASGLRSILRQDPNIIMVGEIRDKETAELAIQASLTGHLVFSTIHTNTSIGIVPRLVDMGIDPYLIAPTLVLAMAQRLVRRVDPSARHEIPLDESTRTFISKEFADLPQEFKDVIAIPEKMYNFKPSDTAPNITRGRIAVFEMFKVDKDVQEIILKNPVDQEIYKVCRAKGMITLKEDALLKSLHGEIMMQEVYAL